MPCNRVFDKLEWSGCRELQNANTRRSEPKPDEIRHCRGGETTTERTKSFNTPPSRPGAHFPASVKIGGRVYEVVFDTNELMLRDDQWGLLDQRASRIVLRDGLDPLVTAEVFIHEVLHAILCHTSTDAHEKDVERVAVGIWQWLHDNAQDVSEMILALGGK